MDKKNLNKQVSDIISDLQSLNTAEILESEGTIKNYSNIIDSVDSDPLSVIGSEIGHWKITELLGQGGMSIVYLVERNDEQFQKKAALKIIPNALASMSMVDRFIRERQILSDLNHNNIAQLYDAGISENEIPWFVMELVQGQDILSYTEINNLDTNQRVMLFKQVCNALIYAHSRGVVHRDIKPNNLMVNEYGTVKLLDFGIAADDEKQSLTKTGAIIGTPGYMSPEQAKGLNNQLDPRTDVFSLGVLLYKLLKEDMPFKAESISEISYKIIHEEPTLMGKAISPDLQAITFKCLEKNKENRYQSVDSLNLDLERYLNGDVISARKISTIGRLTKKVKKHPITFALVVIVFTLLLSGGVFSVYQSISNLKKVQLAEKYTAISQEIKSNVWRTHTLPAHDPNEEYEHYNQQIEALKQQIEMDNASQSGQANFALGKAYQAMRKIKLAHDNFIIARDKGWSSLDLMSSLGVTYTSLWQSALRESKAIKEKDEKQLFIDTAKNDYLDPAMKYLKLASQEENEPYKLQAYIAYNEKNYPKAIEYLKKEIKKKPWDFNVLNMASQIHLFNFQKLSTEKGYDTALQELVKSNQYLEKAIDIGRSYPANYTSRCSNAGIEIQLKRFFDFGRDMEDIFNTGMKYCQEALIMMPKAYSPWANKSYLLTNYARYLEKNDADSHKDKILKIYKRSIENSNKGLEAHPNNQKMLDSKVQPYLSLAKYNKGDFVIAKGYYEKAIEAAKVAAELDEKSINANMTLGLANASYANYLRDIESENMDLLAEEYYLIAINAFKTVNENGKDMMGYMNLAGTYLRYAELKIKQSEFDASIELLNLAYNIREKHTLLKKSLFPHINNYMITATELLQQLQSRGNDIETIKNRTISFMNRVCQIEGLNEQQKDSIKQFINQSVSDNWAQLKSYQTCQL